MKYQEAMEYIESCASYGIVPGLENIEELLKRLGNPEQKLQFIHIAGTNGKGSTLAFISTILTENGYKVGRYISPTIFEYRERFQIQGKPVSKAEIGRLMETVAIQADGMAQEGFSHPTPFEIETALAFLLFAEKECEIVVLETGMGGALDATNVIKNTLISVITSIGYDHMGFLGNTLEEIAGQKAGIIKKDAIVVSAPQPENIRKVLENVAQEKQAKKFVAVKAEEIKRIKYGIPKQSFYYGEAGKIEISLLGAYQIQNAALAAQVILSMQELGFSLDWKKIKAAFLKTQWQARFQLIDKKPLFIVDGAHNIAAAKELRKSIEFYFTNKRIIYIIGMFRDKEYSKVIDITCDLAEHIITLTTNTTGRALSGLELAQEISKKHPLVTVADSVEEAVEISYLLADADTVIIAFGSLSYLGNCIHAVQHRKEMGKGTHGR